MLFLRRTLPLTVALIFGLCLTSLGLTPTRVHDQERGNLIRGIKVRLLIVGVCVTFLASIALFLL